MKYALQKVDAHSRGQIQIMVETGMHTGPRLSPMTLLTCLETYRTMMVMVVTFGIHRKGQLGGVTGVWTRFTPNWDPQTTLRGL